MKNDLMKLKKVVQVRFSINDSRKDVKSFMIKKKRRNT